MKEVRPDGTIGMDIAVRPHVPISNIFVAFATKGDGVTPLNIGEVLANGQPLFGMLNNELEEKLVQQSLDPALEYLDKRAKKFVVSFCERIGLLGVQESDMRCAYYNEDEFVKLVDILSLYHAGDASAACGQELIAEIVRKYNFPSYIVASFFVHELIHRKVDYRTRIYRTEPRDGYPDQLVVPHDPARNGLSVRVADGSRFKGSLLNELGNYFVEAEFIREILMDKNPLLAEDICSREKMVQSTYGSATHVAFDLSFGDLNRERIVLSSDKIHFDPDGKLVHVNVMLHMQLADDINRLCGEVGGASFMMLLLQAKANPRLTGQLKAVMDEKIGSGFFDQLREAKYGHRDSLDDLLSLIKSTQKILYTIS